MRIRDGFDVVRQDVGFALRQLRRSPGFTFAVVGTIALAIGATATMFGIVDRLMLRPPAHVVAPEQVSRVFLTFIAPDGTDGRSMSNLSYDLFRTARERLSPVRIAGSTLESMAVGRGRTAARENVQFVTPGYFALIGVRPRLGRFFSDEEADHLAGSRVAVLGYGAWIRRFGGEDEALGNTIEVEGMPHTIIGVAPRGFHGTGVEPVELWLPMGTLHALPTGHSSFYFNNGVVDLLIRRPPTLSEAAIRGQLTLLMRDDMEEAFRPGRRAAPEVRADFRPLRGAFGPDMARTQEATVAIWLAGVSIVLLLVGCANVASLFLLRAERRGRELAVRMALGVGKLRLALQLFLECATVVLLGAIAAFIVTAFGGAWLRRVLLPDVAWDGWSTDSAVLATTIVALIVTALLTGLAPAVHAWRVGHHGLLVGSARSGTGSTRRSWLRRPLLLAQTALSVLLLAGAGLFLRSLQEMRSVNLGLEPAQVGVIKAEFENIGWRTAEINAFAERARARLTGLAGIENVAFAASAPFVGSIRAGSIRIPGRDSLVASFRSVPTKSTVSPEFFAVTGMQLLRGRGIEDSDRAGAPLVAVINESLAKRYWPDGSALGDCFFVGNVPQCFTVVGIVRDALRFRFDDEPFPHYFLALAQETFEDHPDAVLVRTSGKAEDFVPRIQEALQGVASELPLLDVFSLQSRIDPQARPWELGATVFTIYGAFAMLLSALGLYSAIAYGVVARTRELGVRIAIGARSRQILRLILGDGMRVGALGLALGLGITIVAADRLGERLTDLLFQVTPTDSVVLGGVALVLLLAVLLASLIPAWRATRVDPMIAMRAE